MSSGKTCDSCKYGKCYGSLYTCRLTSRIHFITDQEETCEYCNADLSTLAVCGNCRFFIAPSGDYGLCCSAEYYATPDATSNACEKFQKSDRPYGF